MIAKCYEICFILNVTQTSVKIFTWVYNPMEVDLRKESEF